MGLKDFTQLIFDKHHASNITYQFLCILCLQFHWIPLRILRASFVVTFFRKHDCIKALDFRWRPYTSVSKIKVSFLTFTVTLRWIALAESNTLPTRLLLTGWERQSTVQDDHKSDHSEYFGTIGLSFLCFTNTDKCIPSLRIKMCFNFLFLTAFSE